MPRRERLDPLSHKILGGPLGWVWPGGLLYKLGRFDGRREERLIPYTFGPLGGFYYNAGREHAIAERDRAAQAGDTQDS